MLSVIILSVVMLNFVVLNVVASTLWSVPLELSITSLEASLTLIYTLIYISYDRSDRYTQTL